MLTQLRVPEGYRPLWIDLTEIAAIRGGDKEYDAEVWLKGTDISFQVGETPETLWKMANGVAGQGDEWGSPDLQATTLVEGSS